MCFLVKNFNETTANRFSFLFRIRFAGTFFIKIIFYI